MNWSEFGDYLFLTADLNFLWILVIIGLSIMGIILLKKIKNIEMKTTRRLFLGFGFFILVYGFSRIFFIFANYYYAVGLDNTLIFEIHTRAAYIFGLIAIAFFIYGLEIHFLHTKGFITILPVATAILALFIPYIYLRYITYYSMPIYLIVSLIMYIVVVKNSTGEIRSNAIKTILGLTLFFTGIFFDSRLFKDIFTELGMRWISFILGPVFVLGGMIIFFIVNRKIRH